MCRVEVLKLYRMYIRTSRLARPDMRGMELSSLCLVVYVLVSNKVSMHCFCREFDDGDSQRI